MDEMKQVIQKELKIWQEAYPEWKQMLKKFADKILVEIRLQRDLIPKSVLREKIDELFYPIHDDKNKEYPMISINKLKELESWIDLEGTFCEPNKKGDKNAQM